MTTKLTWPRHPDGRPKKMGEMTRAERRERFVEAVQEVKKTFEHPLMREKVAEILRGGKVQ